MSSLMEKINSPALILADIAVAGGNEMGDDGDNNTAWTAGDAVAVS